MRGTRITVSAPMLTASVSIDAVAERNVGTFVLGENCFGCVFKELSLYLPEIVVFDIAVI